MLNPKSYIAYLHLILLLRVLMPDTAVLALHEHEHTEDKPTSGVIISKAHVHCEVDELFNGSFLSSDFSVELALAPQSGCYLQPYSFAWKFTFPNNTYLRGPP